MDPLGRIDTFIREIDKAKDIEAITLALRKQVDLLGFECFSYQLLKSPQGPRPTYYITAYPKEWTRTYVEKNHVSNDMVSRHAARIIRPFSWMEIGRFDDFTEDQKTVFNEATEFGIQTGGTVPIHGPGLAKALFTVTSSMSEEAFAKLFAARRHEVHLIATYAHERLMEINIQNPLPTNFMLTPRELEVMTWTARGKTKWEISEVLAISETTVKTHLDNACRKLGVSNKTHATAVVLIHGLIIP